MSETFDTDVVVIGYGPSGVAAATFLGSQGVNVVALERFTDIYSRARAVTINDWTLRCFQSAGTVDLLMPVIEETFALRWKTYDGQELQRIVFPPRQLGYASSYSIYQPALEERMREGAARFANVEVRYGQDVVDVVQDDEGVTVTAHDVESGETRTVRARYALACDGGSSPTRERLGIALLGDTVDTQWVVIDAKVKRWWPDRHVLTFWTDKQRPVVDIALALGNHRWELPLAPHETEADFTTHDQLWALLGTMGVTPDDVEIHQHAFYRHHVRQAERWREGRVLLVGDAAHLMPPWAGQGMQSGIRDAHNLAWKLAAVVAGRLSDALLDSYQIERAPNVAHFTRVAVEFGRLVKQELSKEEMAAMAPPPGEPPPPSPLLELPWLESGWMTGDAPAVGRFIPQPLVVTPSGRMARLDDVIGNGFVLLGDNVDPATLVNAATQDAWARLGARFVAVRSPDRHTEAASDVVDLNGELLAWMREHSARAIALRPDRFVAAAEPGGLEVPDARPA